MAVKPLFLHQNKRKTDDYSSEFPAIKPCSYGLQNKTSHCREMFYFVARRGVEPGRKPHPIIILVSFCWRNFNCFLVLWVFPIAHQRGSRPHKLQ